MYVVNNEKIAINIIIIILKLVPSQLDFFLCFVLNWTPRAYLLFNAFTFLFMCVV